MTPTKAIGEPCSRCQRPVTRLRDAFHWRGTWADGAYCKPCNALWPIRGEEIEPLRGPNALLRSMALVSAMVGRGPMEDSEGIMIREEQRFGDPSWTAVEGAAQVERPIGTVCRRCEEPIGIEDDGLIDGGGSVLHRECVIRAAAGSVGHQRQRCHCFGGSVEDEDPPGLTRREAARAAMQEARTYGPGRTLHVVAEIESRDGLGKRTLWVVMGGDRIVVHEAQRSTLSESWKQVQLDAVDVLIAGYLLGCAMTQRLTMPLTQAPTVDSVGRIRLGTVRLPFWVAANELDEPDEPDEPERHVS